MSELPVHSGGDEISAHPRHTGHRWLDLTLAVCAIFISAVSLIVTIEHGQVQRELVAANSWPFLRSEFSDAHGETADVLIGVTNAGVGPAKVRSFEMFLDGKPVGSPGDLLGRCCGLSSDRDTYRRQLPPNTVSMSLIDNTVLRPGEPTTSCCCAA